MAKAAGGNDQNIKIGADAGQAVSELQGFEAELAKQAIGFDKIISQMNRYNTTGDLTDKIIKLQAKSGEELTLEYANIAGALVKTAAGLSKAGNSFGTFQQKVEKATNSQKDFTNAQAAVVASLGKDFAKLPDDATQSSIEQLEREKNRLAKIIAGRSIKGGVQGALQNALNLAQAGEFSDKKGLLGNIERQVFNIVQAFERVNATSAKVQANIRAQAQASAPVIDEQAAAIAREAAEMRALEAAVRRLDDAKDLRAILQGQLGFKQSRPNAPQFAGVEQSFNKLVKQVEEGAIGAERVLQLFDQIQKKQQVVFASKDEEQAFAALKQLTTQQERYNKSLADAIAKRKALQQGRIDRKAAGTANTQASSLIGELRSDLNIDVGKISIEQAGRLSRGLASIQAAVSSNKITIERVIELYDQVKRRQDIVFAGPKDNSVAASLQNLINLQAKLNSTIDTTSAKNAAQEKINKARLANKQEAAIVQRFGGIPETVDASQIQRIQSASTALNTFLRTGNIAKAQFKSVLSTFESDASAHLTGLDGKLIKLFRNLRGAIDGVPTPLERILNGFNRLGISWQGLTAIFASQIIYGSLSRMISLLETSLRTAAKFSIKIAEIRTLTEGNAISADTWATSLRSVSDSFGIDLLDATAAAYDVLSNQVAKGTNAINFLKEAAVFSKITVSSLQDSVNLLSASVNAYRNQGLTAQRASEILFSTIDLGKVRVDEIANTFGNVAILAAQVGVSFEDLNATFATITIQGTRADTAMTLLNNIMLKLLKPTGEIKKLMREWGVETGPAAVKTFTFLGVLEKVNKAVEEGKLAFEDANESRAIRGFLAAASNSGLDIVEENRAKQEAAAANKKRAAEIALNSPGALFQKQLVQFQNIITQDVAKAIFEAIVKITEGFGGIKQVLITLTAAFQGPINVVLKFGQTVSSVLSLLKLIPGASTGLALLSNSLGGVVAAFATYKTVTLATALANTALGKSFLSFATTTLPTLGRSVLSFGRTLLNTPIALGSISRSLNTLKTSATAVGTSIDLLKFKVAALTLGIPLLIGALASVSAAAAQTRLDLVQSSKEAIDETNQILFNAQVSGFEKYLDAIKKNNTKNNQQIRQANAALSAELNRSVVEETENVRRQRILLANAGFQGAINFDFTVNGEEKDPKNALKEISDGVRKSIDESLKLEKQLSSLTFNNLLVGTDPFASTQLVFDRLESLQKKVSDLFDSRNMEGVRDTFKEINDLIKEQLIGREGLDGIIQKTKDELEQLKIGDSVSGKKKAGAAAEEKGLAFLDLGNIKEATAEFAKADKLFSGLNTKAKSFDKQLAKLGVKVPTSRGTDEASRLEARLKALQKVQASDKNPETRLKALLEQQLKTEKSFQELQVGKFVESDAAAKKIAAENALVDDQEAAHEQLGVVLKKNVETHNETLAILNDQLLTVRKTIAEIDSARGTTKFLGLPLPNDPFTLESITGNNPNVEKLLGLSQLKDLEQKIDNQRKIIVEKSAAFEANQNAETFKQLDEVRTRQSDDLRALSELLLQKQEAIKALQGGAETPAGIQTGEAFRKIQETLELEKKQLKELQEIQRDTFNKNSAINTPDALFQTQPVENFGLTSEEVLSNMSGQLAFVIGQVRELNAALGSTTVKPTQLGRSAFATRINRPESITPAGETQGQALVINGGLNVYVKEVVDNKIDPVEISRALQRATRQGLIG